MNIYLDTMLWNALCDHAVDPQKFVTSLAARDANLALGLHNFYELAKTFRTQTTEAVERGRRLFSYLSQFLDAGILCVKENDELLAMEMWALKLSKPSVDAFLGEGDLLLVRKGFEELSNGGFDERTARFIKEQQAFASNIRSSQRQCLESRPDARRYLRSISPQSLGQWLEAETYSSAGLASLKGHVLTRFPEAPETEAIEYASALLASSACRTARAMVRAGSYYIWRCAYRDSVPSDLFDDMYHVLNSVYCDVYATQEGGQAGYAELLLTASTRVAIYESETPIDQWLQGLVRQ